jgi:hypothetical protein
MLTTEVLLMLLVTGLYLYDSALLLYANEGLLVTQGRQGWAVAFGSRHTTLRGRQLYVPNPLRPTQALFRLAWSAQQPPAGAQHGWSGQRADLARLSPAVWSLALVLFVLLPVTLFARLGDLAVVLSFSLIYLNVLLMLALLWLDRRRLALTPRHWAMIALDLLICPPFALNVVRRLSLRVNIREDFIEAARHLLAPTDWEAIRPEILARLDDEMAVEEEGSPRWAALHERRRQLM